MILGERSKVRIRGIKGRLEERERGTFCIFRDPEKEKKGTRRENKERRKRENKP